MEVNELRDLIQEIHDSGDCGYMLSDVLEMANKICDQPSDLEIVQKALSVRNGVVLVDTPGCTPHYVGGAESLLTWAKQTIGVE